MPPIREPAHTQKSARLSSHSSLPSLGKREISGSGSILNLRVSHFTQLAMSSVVQACGSTGTNTGEGGGSLSVSELAAAAVGVGGETDTGGQVGGTFLLLLLLLLLLEVVSELEVEDSSELEEELLLLLLLRALRGRSLVLDTSLVVFVSCAASSVVSAGVVVSVVVVEVLVDAPTQFGRASWCMA